MPGALEGTRVIDFGQYIAGPLTGMLLADQGADVIKVDPPGGPLWKTPGNATWNRGKRSILLDLKQPGDLAAARSLVQSADVVVENFRPGVMDRLGLGPEEMTRAHPRLVYCSLPGFASDDPRAAVPAWEGVVVAASGNFLLSAVGLKPVMDMDGSAEDGSPLGKVQQRGPPAGLYQYPYRLRLRCPPGRRRYLHGPQRPGAGRRGPARRNPPVRRHVCLQRLPGN